MVRTLLLLAVGTLVGCSPSEPAVADPGVCWRVRDGGREVLDRVANLETCAQRLEAVRMMDGGAVEGAFEGRLIFVTEAALTQARSQQATRYPVFEPAERAQVQAAIQALLDREAGRRSAGRTPPP